MNIFFAILIIFIILYILLNWFAKTSTKKISKFVRTFIIISSILLAVIMAYAGRYIFSLPFMLAILPLIKTKAGISLFQLFRLWGLLRVLKNSGRFNFNQFNQNVSSQAMSTDESYRILNLDPKKKYTKDDVQKSYKKIIPCGITTREVTNLKNLKDQKYNYFNKKVIKNFIKYLKV